MPTIADKSNIKIGTKVVRGRDWKWGVQDHHNGVPSVGEVIQYVCCFPYKPNSNWAKIKWESGLISGYRIGGYGAFDLYLYEPEQKPATPTTKFKEGDFVTLDKIPVGMDMIGLDEKDYEDLRGKVLTVSKINIREIYVSLEFIGEICCYNAEAFTYPKTQSNKEESFKPLKVGDYIKALVDYPSGGGVKKDEIGKVVDFVDGYAYINFPSQHMYQVQANKYGKAIDTTKYAIIGTSDAKPISETVKTNKFKVGDVVKLVNTDIDPKYWKGIGKVNLEILKNRLLEIEYVKGYSNCEGLIFKENFVEYNYTYPEVCFELASIKDAETKSIEKEKPTNIYGLTVGMHLPCDVLEAWERTGYNRNASAMSREWIKAATHFRTDRKIVEFKVLDGVVGFLISSTPGVYHRAEGFKEFLEKYQKDNTETPQLIKSEPTITITGKVTDIVPYPDVEIKVKPKKKKPTI